MTEYKWCAIDAEGDVGDKGLLGVAFYSDTMARYVTDRAEMVFHLEAHAENGYTFLAHNAQYDLSVIFWQLGIPMKARYYGGRFYRGEWKYKRGAPACQLWDTYALSGKGSLRELGSALECPKYETPQRLRGLDPDRYGWTCELHSRGECEECYALRDAEIVWRFATELESSLKAWGVEPASRIGTIAQRCWQRLDNPAPPTLRDRRVTELARRSYHGGRCETYKLGRFGQVYTADVQSMYPSVMLETPMPDPQAMVYLVQPRLEHVPLDVEGCAEAHVTVPDMYIPPLPCSYKGELHYPIGVLHGYWTLAELRYARSLGCTIQRIEKVAYSHSSLYPFTNFIGTLWAMREEYTRTNDPRAFMAKLLMNNLYGRLGMTPDMEQKQVYPAVKGKSFKIQKKDMWYTSEGELYIERECTTYANRGWTNVLWAAQITAAARIKLHRHLLAQGAGIIYTDTDSVVSLSPIVGTGSGLGQLRATGTHQSAIVSAPKLYALQDAGGGWAARAKGVPTGVALEYLTSGSATYQQPVTPAAQGRKGVKAGTWIDMRKEHHYAPARRRPIDPSVLLSEYGWSDTVPTYWGPA